MKTNSLDLMTSREVAAALRLTRARVAALARQGVLPAARIGAHGRYRFRREDVERLINGGSP